MTRQKVKRALLDELDAMHKFELPPSLVEQEFDNVWKTIDGRPASQQAHLRGRGHDRGEGAEEYRKIAERRVRLGLVLAEIGENATTSR